MTPALQSAIVVLVVAVAMLYVGRRAWRTIAAARRRNPAGACGDGCGCGDDTAR